jgi:hypothetical protein
MFLGCSTSHIKNAWENTKKASYNATTDYGTWIPFVSSTLLYSTQYDNKITSYLMENEVINMKYDDTLRDINGYETYITAIFIDDNSYMTKSKRILSEFIAFKTGVQASDILNYTIDKRSPEGGNNYAIGSQHAMGPFVGSAMTRRNTEQLSIPTWAKYTLNTISYTTATASAITRVEDGGHSFADQLISVSVGNFIGIFFHDLFMLDKSTIITTTYNDKSTYINLTYRY